MTRPERTSMRVCLFTGKGGVGKTTQASAAAALSAERGLRTLVISTDAAHSVADALGLDLGGGHGPVRVAPNLDVEHVDAQRRFEESWADLQSYVLTVLDAVGVDQIAAEELSIVPGVEEVMALLALRDRLRAGEWDVVVVDCAPTAETLRLLALPDALQWYMRRVFPAERRVMTALRPVLSRATSVPMPGGHVFDAVEKLYADLSDIRRLLSDPGASVRAVLTPESVVVAEARRAYTSLSLYGYRLDGVIANRVFPDGPDAWRQGWVEAQRGVLAEVETSFAGLPLWTSTYAGAEPVGLHALAEVARQTYGDADPWAVPAGESPLRMTTEGRDVVMTLKLPGAAAGDVDVGRHGTDLVLTVGGWRRVVALPAAAARARVVEARMRDGSLVVRLRREDT